VLDHALPALAPVAPRVAQRLGIPLTLPGASGVAVTFDDGPHPEGTPAILKTLRDAGVRATFFLVGEQVERRPELAAQIGDEKHLIALHGYRHRLQLRLGADALKEDLRRGIEAIVRATGHRPMLHRPPYGIYSGSGLALVRDAGLRPLLWSRWGKDWRRLTTPARIAARATENVRAGDVILLHDADFYSARGSHRRTAHALPVILAELDRRGIATVLPV
jgi:peptidoglycan/xylan/chitin deacetylase (PgdA/CDA1 family)